MGHTEHSMTNRIDELFGRKSRSILSVFYTAGFPSLNDTAGVAESLQEAGADLIEIGIPFSDPVADGPVIQESNAIALSNGMTVSKLIDQVTEARKSVTLPIILMGYLNPVLQYGFDQFCRDAARAGADGIIIPDLPLNVYERDYQSSMEASGLKMIFLISPTTSEERIRRIDEVSQGFIYAVSASSTTGAKGSFDPGQEAYFKRLQAMKLKNHFLIGFGISNGETFRMASQYGAGAIVGSAFISMLGNSANRKRSTIGFVNELRGLN